MLFINTSLFCQDNEVFCRIKLHRVYTDVGDDALGENEFRFSFWLNDQWENPALEKVDNGYTGRNYGANKTREITFTGTSLKIDMRFWEDDSECGEDYEYNPSCDDDMRLSTDYFVFSGHPSGTNIDTSYSHGGVTYYFQIEWYPAPLVSSYESFQHSDNEFPWAPYPDPAPLWNRQVSDIIPAITYDNTSSNILCGPFTKMLKSDKKCSSDNGSLIFYEYQDSDGVWKNFPRSPSIYDTLFVNLDENFYQLINDPDSLLARLQIRISRRTLTGNFVGNVDDYDVFDLPICFPFGDRCYTYFRFKQQNAQLLDRYLAPPPPTFSSDTLTGIAPTCFHDSNGVLNIYYDSISGFGRGHYKVSLGACDIYPDCPYPKGTRYFYRTNEQLPNLKAGLFRLEITDVQHFENDKSRSGCSNFYPVIIPEKPPIAVTATDTVYTNTEVRCFNTQDGIATLTISGGNPPYQAAPTDSIYQAVTESTHKLYNLAPGFHTFYAKDSKGCPIAIVRDTITVPDTLRLYLQMKKQFVQDTIERGERHVSCFHASDGRYTVHTRCDIDASKVNPNFRYWITGTTTQGANYASDTLIDNTTSIEGVDYAETFTNLSAGFFTIHLKDNNNCYFTDTFSLREPSPLTLDKLESKNNLCAEGQEGVLKVLAGGATHPYSYYKNSWDPYPASSWRVCTWNNFIDGYCNNSEMHNTGQTMKDTAYYSNLPSYNAHIAYVRDTNGCITPLPFTISEPASIIPNIITKNVECKGEANGMLVATATGGVPPYYFNWNRLGAPLANNDTLANVTAGKYSVKITDANGCIRSTINYDVLEANFPLTATAAITEPISCADNNNAKISVTALGGGTGYQYSLNGTDWQTSKDFDRLSAGIYTIQVMDNLGCHIVLPALQIIKPNALTATLINTPKVSCHNTSDAVISLEISGGTPDYFYKKNGEWMSFESPLSITGTPAGDNLIELRDNNNCQLTKTITVSAPPPLTFSISSKTDAAINNDDGSVSVTASGGTSPYTYQWKNQNNDVISASPEATNLFAGMYFITITDNNGCDTTRPVGISNVGGPTETSNSTIITAPLCHDSEDGSISVTYAGTIPITYTWYPGEINGAVLSGIPSGEYVLQVTDGNGAITTANYSVQAPEALMVHSSTSNLLCHNACDAFITLGVSGGSGPYSVQWNSGQNTSRINNLCAGNYSYQVADVHNCKVSGEVEILNPTPVEVSIGEDRTLCRGQVAVLDATLSNCSYLWNTGSTNKSITTVDPGDYSVIVTTPDGCTGSDTLSIEVSDNLLAAVNYNATKIYAGTTIVFVDVSWPRPDNLEWDFGDSAIVINDNDKTLPQVQFPYPGTFKIEMIAHLGDCKDTIYKTVKVFALDDSVGFQNGRYISGIEDLKAFPNPASHSVNLVLKMFTEENVVVNIVDGFGNIVRQKSLEGKLEYETAIDLDNLSQGIYILRAYSGQSQKSLIITIK